MKILIHAIRYMLLITLLAGFGLHPYLPSLIKSCWTPIP